MIRHSRLGFSLIELMIVLAISPIVVSAAGSLWLQYRDSTVRVESSLSLERQSGLALEWLGRDLRSSSCIRTLGRGPTELGTVVILGRVAKDSCESDSAGAVTYQLSSAGLVRSGRSESILIAKQVSSVELTEADDGLVRVQLELERPMPRGKRVAIVREGSFRRRRPRSRRRRGPRPNGSRGNAALLAIMVVLSGVVLMTVGLRRRTADLATEDRTLDRIQARWAADSAAQRVGRGAPMPLRGELLRTHDLVRYATHFETGAQPGAEKGARSKVVVAEGMVSGSSKATRATIRLSLSTSGTIESWSEGPDFGLP